MRTREGFLTLIAELEGEYQEYTRLMSMNRRAWDRIVAGANDGLAEGEPRNATFDIPLAIDGGDLYRVLDCTEASEFEVDVVQLDRVPERLRARIRSRGMVLAPSSAPSRPALREPRLMPAFPDLHAHHVRAGHGKLRHRGRNHDRARRLPRAAGQGPAG